MASFKRWTLMLCVIWALYSFAVVWSMAAPLPPWLAGTGVFNQSADCQNDDELLDLCQRCAKLTKSKVAYPACCSTDLQARKWCSDYVYFGRTHNEPNDSHVN